MQKRKLGKHGPDVPVVIFGAWAIGGWWWGPTDDEAAVDAIRAGIDAGIDCIDTAPIYGCGHSEEVVGKAIKGRRDEVIVATKCGLVWDRTDGEFYFSMAEGNRSIYRNLKADSIKAECDRSLQRLGIEHIDLYQCHWPDPTTHIDDTMAALLDLQTQGKVKHIGVSNFTSEMMKQCLESGRIESDQPRYNLLDREIETDIVPFCQANQLSLIVYSPLAQGLLTGKVTVDRKFEEGDSRAGLKWFQPQNRQLVLDALEKLRPIADAHKCTLAQLTLAWTVAQPGITSAIAGARTPQQARENAVAGEISLSAEEAAAIGQTFAGLTPV